MEKKAHDSQVADIMMLAATKGAFQKVGCRKAVMAARDLIRLGPGGQRSQRASPVQSDLESDALNRGTPLAARRQRKRARHVPSSTPSSFGSNAASDVSDAGVDNDDDDDDADTNDAGSDISSDMPVHKGKGRALPGLGVGYARGGAASGGMTQYPRDSRFAAMADGQSAASAALIQVARYERDAKREEVAAATAARLSAAEDCKLERDERVEERRANREHQTDMQNRMLASQERTQAMFLQAMKDLKNN